MTTELIGNQPKRAKLRTLWKLTCYKINIFFLLCHLGLVTTDYFSVTEDVFTSLFFGRTIPGVVRQFWGRAAF